MRYLLFLSLILFSSFLNANEEASEVTAVANKCANASRKAGLSKAASKMAHRFIEMTHGKDATRSEGLLVQRYHEGMRTTIYHTASEPLADGSVPLIDPASKAVAIFFHGSGTEKSSGRNFIHNMNSLANEGISCMAMDLPFHGKSKADTLQYKKQEFMKALHKVIAPAKASGKKIILFGHSFGPDIAAEYAKTYPGDVDHIILVSPAPSGSEPHEWMYKNVTEPGMPLVTQGQGTVTDNERGGEWAGSMGAQFNWLKEGIPSSVGVTVMIGSKDEWQNPISHRGLPKWANLIKPTKGSPALGNEKIAQKLGVKPKYDYTDGLEVIKEAIPHADFQIVDDWGHYIFEAEVLEKRRGKETPVNLINKTILDVAGINVDERGMKKEDRSSRLKLRLLYENSATFRDWLTEKGLPQAVKDEKVASNVLQQWDYLQYEVWRDALENMESRYPEYYKSRQYWLARLLKDAPQTKEQMNGTTPDVDTSNLSGPEKRAAKKAKRADTVKEKEEFMRKISSWDLTAIQSDFRRWLSDHEKGSALLDEDPMKPSPPPLSKDIVGKESHFTAGYGPIRKEEFDNLKGPEILNIEEERLSSIAVKRKYKFKDKDREQIVLEVSEKELNEMVEEAFLDATKKNGYIPPLEKWEGVSRGLVFKVIQKYVPAEKRIIISEVAVTGKAPATP